MHIHLAFLVSLLLLLLYPVAVVAVAQEQQQQQQYDDAALTLTSAGTPDPFVTIFLGQYYLLYTAGNRVEMWSSNSLVDIERSAIRHRIWTPPPDSEHSTELWAPELHAIGGRWYIYYTAADGKRGAKSHRMYVLGGPPSMEHPVSGQWEFLGRVRGMPEQWAIDGTVLEMDDGQLYLAYSGWPLDEREVYKPEEDDPLVLYRGEYDWQVDMIDDDEGGGRGRGGSDSKKKKIKHDVSGLLQHIYLLRLASPTTAGSKPAVIGSPTEEWEITRDHNSEGAAHAINEGPEWLISPDGRWRGLVYSCAASWTSEYKMATLQYIGGPPLSASSWKKAKAPLLQTRKEDGDGGVYGPGHGSFVDLGNGTVVAVYHATRGPRDGWRGRLARVQRVAFLKDGAPYMGPISPSSSSGSRSRFHNGGIKAADTSLIGKILRMFFGLGPHAAGDGGGPSGGEMKQVQMRAFLETARANRAELGVDANGSDCDGA